MKKDLNRCLGIRNTAPEEWSNLTAAQVKAMNIRTDLPNPDTNVIAAAKATPVANQVITETPTNNPNQQTGGGGFFPGGGMGGGGGGGGNNEGAATKKPNYLLYSVVATGALFITYVVIKLNK